GATSATAVSLKPMRRGACRRRPLGERTPRRVRLTADGEAFLEHAKTLIAANQRALSMTPAAACRLRLGVSDHAAGPELPTLLARLNAADPRLAHEVTLGLSRPLLELFDDGKLDGAIVR